MDEEDFRTTLAYTKSPKTSKRTSFQDELEAAVNARAGRQRPVGMNTYSDDFEEDDDEDILQELLKTRRKKMDMFKAARIKQKTIHFELSDDEDKEEENIKPKKVSFLKSSRRSESSDRVESSRRSESSDRVESSRRSESSDRVESSRSVRSDRNDFLSHTHSPLTSRSESEGEKRRTSLSESPVPLNSENSLGESGPLFNSPLPLPSEPGEEKFRRVIGAEAPVPHPRRSPTGLVEDTPRPVPRQRAHQSGSSGHDEENGRPETASSRAACSSVSLPVWSTESRSAASAFSIRTGTGGTGSEQQTRQPHASSTTAMTDSSSVEGARGRDLSITGQNKQDRSAESSQECQSQASDDPPHRSATETSVTSQSRPASSRKSRSALSSTSESRYLGTLKILNETQPDAADSLRAAVYQEWLKNKEEKLQVTIRAKKQEEKLKEEKKSEDELNKKTEAKASYEAWREKKQETLREKVREKQETLRKKQKELDEREEKKETAKRVFGKWKREHDELLREQTRKRVEKEKRLKEREERGQQERKRECSSTFNQWSERKKNTIAERTKVERREKGIQLIEEKYEKEERQRTALETYEKWLTRKEFQQKRDLQEKKVKSIVPEEPPPPWSPPNRTVPFGQDRCCNGWSVLDGH
ncbi:microtubule-associated protein 9 isoform X2 [Trichomycterus rosablanca]|uniref:microtubule-associated protein 9 isoform X2 n=1 Tax=Trichomycterus rosablanca TaxID=2290929 RepID=UPI002F3605BC